MILCALLVLLLPSPVWAAPTQPERTPLTLELLQERLRAPTLREGNLTVDLRQLVIDLRPENSVFRDGFYQLLRKELQKTGAKPLGLDLSYSLIQGDFVGSDLGLRTPLYAQAIAPIFTKTEQEQLERLRLVCLQSLAASLPNSKDCRSLLGTQSTVSSDVTVFRGALTLEQTRFNGEVTFVNTFFLQSVNAKNATFLQPTHWHESRFSRGVNFNNASFRQASDFQDSVFFDKANFKQTQFQETANFQRITFESVVNFNEAQFKQLAKFSGVQWQDNADFSGVRFANQAQFTRANFNQSLSLVETTFEQAVIFREALFNQPVDLRGASILNQADFSDAIFSSSSFLNVPGLTFNSNQAKILGNPGQIGQMFDIPTLQGNQNVLRNLGQNFRQQQQVADANQLEYTKQQLRLKELSKRLIGTNINSASVVNLVKLGFSPTQANVIDQRRQIKAFRNSSELLTLADIDLEIYNKLSDRLVVAEPLSLGSWLLEAWLWLALSVLLLLSGYGTNFWLVFGVGGVAIAYFGLVFWLVDRARRLRPVPIIPTYYETVSVLISFSCLEFFSLLAIFQNAEQPLLTLGCILIIIVPVPVTLLMRLYQQGRYHDLINVSYFTEDGTFRQLRLLIGRLPVIPRNPTFRERYMPLLSDRHWNWLNYYDFSLNNLVRLGFNDIRLRDEHLPGIIATLAWYQWSLGVLYITLVLWTLSRTIPGLNLLIYLK
ncbi:pentapeptide repeat-containing protein [Trichormus variabilis ARAD]|uniref:Pentapeptide repeat-containing protein n=1 Tax=Trichormus variabilis N2B TaxID=2681315 RepID=A0ABR6S327_ANAVA|nr:pentapeptide repeat-containing protein [Trichormus variabilis ARAD]MBC1255216.1 pentapeptide repeat-containing protein [Trichormus variabilis V5]MBC1268562.1 pentapeptide repeat-containing protein [Trichormus variabilis FSR]MBC1300780.1 pentapeptide repeat-containing protein [Trichormus variabilis N2B]MBC1312737.1 pentapeptide repeat-containing protein [Trichormus variabilis PNB]MBC1326370.1 pentapeptide repeat-containing protein [Trichormus variabilis 9RC]MBD2380535.1 pentapeptide repeat-